MNIPAAELNGPSAAVTLGYGVLADPKEKKECNDDEVGDGKFNGLLAVAFMFCNIVEDRDGQRNLRLRGRVVCSIGMKEAGEGKMCSMFRLFYFAGVWEPGQYKGLGNMAERGRDTLCGDLFFPTICSCAELGSESQKRLEAVFWIELLEEDVTGELILHVLEPVGPVCKAGLVIHCCMVNLVPSRVEVTFETDTSSGFTSCQD